MGVYPSASATRAIETAARPSASARPMAARTMRAVDRAGLGPRRRGAAAPHRRRTAAGSGSAAVSSGSGCSGVVSVLIAPILPRSRVARRNSLDPILFTPHTIPRRPYTESLGRGPP
nr:hypothetical protein GCM10025730_31480 [Promicromonospora thailandica]